MVSISTQDAIGLSVDRATEQAILQAVKGIRFGSVEIIIHDSKVVQIERKEKTRFDHPPSRFVSGSGKSGAGAFPK